MKMLVHDSTASDSQCASLNLLTFAVYEPSLLDGLRVLRTPSTTLDPEALMVPRQSLLLL